MRLLLILAAVLALPVLVIAHRQHFLNHQQDALRERVRRALDDPKFSGIRDDGVQIDYLDISLRGWVADPDAREEARRRANAVPGARCREADNHLLVTPRIHGALEGEKLALTGWLRDDTARRELARWLEQARPGLRVETGEVRLSPFVARVDLPGTGSNADKVPPVFAEVWNSIRGRASLRIERDARGQLHATGEIPSAALRDALLEVAPDTDTSGLRAGAYVRQARFTNEKALPAFLRSLFQSPAVELFEAGGETVRIRAAATPELEEEWRRLLSPLADDGVGTLELWLVSSRLQLPGYRPESPLDPEALNRLRAELAPVVFHFNPGIHWINEAEIPLIASAVQSLRNAGPQARIVVGAHLDAVGDPKLNEDSARRRAGIVMAEMKERGIPAAQLEAAILPPTPGPDGGDQSRCVELLVK